MCLGLLIVVPDIIVLVIMNSEARKFIKHTIQVKLGTDPDMITIQVRTTSVIPSFLLSRVTARSTQILAGLTDRLVQLELFMDMVLHLGGSCQNDY